MTHMIPELRELGEHLEAEAEGRPFDRRRAHVLAHRIAERHPDIRKTMNLLVERLGEERV
ncbi:hypothetical protein [Magnetospirillum moscoviense]|uniref:Uncharacterized protein n=1 Tax=Magnetospirillum moscoviense TaxID=1437059 RepID=A0A178ML12_9PROT|nr:hypothetical protein [Magnetospirillum moscoviense]MBF0326985.1 hypothetical protein [Alphaproteobacteria bacterium]OAN49422.1 hypothetical protein A6A05_13825 [Magnetospirillum moscoviense]